MLNKLVGLTPLFQVFDMPTALAFYRDKLGFDVVSASPVVETPEGRFSHWMWLRSGNVDLMLNTAYDSGERPSERDASRIAAHSDTCLFIGCSDLDSAYAALIQTGLTIEPPAMSGYGMRRFSLHDPDNFELVFQEA
ncbi:putative glyoxalase superfamily protein PhnB [Luteibacter rhizovicinus]|uniref:Putative glyoxalase superfamily protein PhnB n=1 Tax=Luteibacter rhizovicinus TaxID=242606 RepID=A0A4R3YTV3_9GAMM|nr:VOC family protein [Luteibacter rhizovicinus]TCV96387.1 putative glyoxalase superfamily protein PhnB [Luteibacter rhizovicinus]